MSDEKLLPCPFCGDEPELHWINEAGEVLTAWVSCKCGCEHHERLTRELAVKKWNSRHLPNDAQASRDCGVNHVEFRTNIINHCANICKSLREKHGSPVGDAYSNGVWDQGVRTEQAIRGLTEALSLSSANRGSEA